ncbi:hypothetical protein Plec18170_006066 [Paecilomyces lecythidis]
MGAKAKGSARPPPSPQLDLNIGDEPPKLRVQAQKLFEQIAKLKDTAREKESPPPLDLFVELADVVCQFAQRVKNEPTLNTVEQEIRNIKEQLNRRLAREDQVFKQLDTLAAQTDRVATAVSPRGSASYRDAALRSHVASSSESFVTGWNNRVPSTLSPAPGGRGSEGPRGQRSHLPCTTKDADMRLRKRKPRSFEKFYTQCLRQLTSKTLKTTAIPGRCKPP